jgi:hypothetical protein
MIVLIRVLVVSIDEGGSQGQLLVSVQVGSYSSVLKLNREWNRGLVAAGCGHFHSKDFGNLSGGVFKGLSKSKRRALLAKLVDLIHKHLELGVTAVLDTETFDREMPQDCRGRWTSAYTFALFSAIGAAHCHLERRGRHTEEVDILVAAGHRNCQQALDRLAEFPRGEVPLRIKTQSRGEMADHPMLQAADILAYSEWRELSGRREDIWHALNSQRRGRYATYSIECGPDLIKAQKDAWNERAAVRIEWGARKIV